MQKDISHEMKNHQLNVTSLFLQCRKCREGCKCVLRMYYYPFSWPAFTNQPTCEPPSRRLHRLHQPLYTGSLLAAVISSCPVGCHRHSQNTVTSCSPNNLQCKEFTFCHLKPTSAAIDCEAQVGCQITKCWRIVNVLLSFF